MKRTKHGTGRASPLISVFGGTWSSDLELRDWMIDPRNYRIGDVIAGSYRVLRVFGGAGASGMGVVYLVEEPDAPEPFVLKACQTADSRLAAMFKREAEVWVRIGVHPNVTKAFWVRELDGQLFVAAEYVDGVEEGRGSLSAVIGKTVSPSETIRWATQFCSGLEHALVRGLIAHRDIKPANLLLTRRGDLKIADFGLGKVAPSSVSQAKGPMTATGVTGTLPYMAPEQVQGAPTDHSADIYAFGIVMYELCSGGAYPYALRAPNEVASYVAAHLRGAVRRLESPFWGLIERSMARSPRERWQSSRDLAAAVREVARKLGLPCPPLIPPQPVGLEDLYAKAQSLGALGQSDAALAAIDHYLVKAPDAFWAWTERGRILMDLRRDAEAEQATRRSLALDPSNSHAWNNLGVLLQRLDRLWDSVDAYEQAIQCNPVNSGAMMNAAQPLCATGRHDRAAALLCTALELAPDKETLRFNAGNVVAIMLQDRAFAPAEKLARALLTADPSNSQAWHNLGALLSGTGHQEEAVQSLRIAVNGEPNNAVSRLLLARLLAQAGLIEEACSHLDHLIGRGDHLSKAACFKAQLLAHQGRGRDAMVLLEDLLERVPEDDAAWFVLCGIAEQHRDVLKALQAARACQAILRRRGAQANPANVRWARGKIHELQSQLRT
jgi:serine/threonine protein kinase